MTFRGQFTLGGISASQLETLADALVRDAAEADGQPAVAVRDRHVNTEELRAVCAMVLVKTKRLGEEAGLAFQAPPDDSAGPSR